MSVDALQLTQIPTVHVGMLVHKPPSEAFQAFVDPAITTKFWFTRSSDKMTPGAELRWDWEMYGVSTKVAVKEVGPTIGSASSGVTTSRRRSSCALPLGGRRHLRRGHRGRPQR
jgi:hypothetical protein